MNRFSLALITVFGLLFCWPKVAEASAVQVSVDGQQITVNAEIAVVGGSPDLIQDWQTVIDAIYNSEDLAYKCYTVRMNVELRSVTADEVGNEEYVLQVLDLTSDSADRETFEDFGMYTSHDWRLYDHSNNTAVYGDCHAFQNQQYNASCAELSQWFFDNGYAKQRTLGYVEHVGSITYEGTSSGQLTGYVTSSSTGTVVAHEIGHLLGFRHLNDQTSLMHPTANSNHLDIRHTNLESLLDNMTLDCRWDLSLPSINMSAEVEGSCPYVCEINRYVTASAHWSVESLGKSLIGQGEVLYDTVKAEGCGCSASVINDGSLTVSGNIQNYTGDSSYPSAYELHISHTYDLPPLEEYCSVNSNFLEALLEQAGFTSWSVPLGNPEDPKMVLTPVVFSQDYSDTFDCNVFHYQLGTEPLEVINITPIQRTKTPLHTLID